VSPQKFLDPVVGCVMPRHLVTTPHHTTVKNLCSHAHVFGKTRTHCAGAEFRPMAFAALIFLNYSVAVRPYLTKWRFCCIFMKNIYTVKYGYLAKIESF
jgi:hypothetical protein